jgi:hypothetical protein
MSEIGIIRTDSNHADFIVLVKELDAYLSIRNGDDDAFLNNLIQLI